MRKFLTGIDLGLSKIVNLLTPTASTDAATKGYVDATGIGRMGRAVDTSGPNTFTVETLIASVTFTAVAGRRYEVKACGSLTNSGSGYACALNVRWATGASVTTAGTLLVQMQNSAIQFTQYVSGFDDLTGLSAGQVTVGVFAAPRSVGSGGSTSWGNGATQPTSLTVEDVGT